MHITGPRAQETVYTTFALPSRRFTEDSDSWDMYRSQVKPLDQYTMPYNIPQAMASLQSYTNFPLFVG